MARIKLFKDPNIAIYIYGEAFGKHHRKHVLVIKNGESYQYGFNGKPIKNTPGMKNKNDEKTITEWIVSRKEKLEVAWEQINRGILPDEID